MIYDYNKDLFVNTLDINLVDKKRNIQGLVDNECEVILKVDYINLSYFKEWYSLIYAVQGFLKYHYEYKRDIFLLKSENSHVLIKGCYISSILPLDNNLFEIRINCDYYEIGRYPELKKIYRDKKIDLILS